MVKNKFNDEYKILVAPNLEIPMTKDIDADTVLNNEKALNISELASLIRIVLMLLQMIQDQHICRLI